MLLLMVSSNTRAQKTEHLNWMLGTWKISSQQNTIVEEWRMADDSTLIGKTYMIQHGTDTLPQETIELAYRLGYWYYIPTVSNQNNSLPVAFKIIYLNKSEFISENPAHDFPQRISYRRINRQLLASIEGKKNGRYSKMNFDYLAE
jgi:hypothetical protein